MTRITRGRDHVHSLWLEVGRGIRLVGACCHRFGNDLSATLYELVGGGHLGSDAIAIDHGLAQLVIGSLAELEEPRQHGSGPEQLLEQGETTGMRERRLAGGHKRMECSRISR